LQRPANAWPNESDVRIGSTRGVRVGHGEAGFGRKNGPCEAAASIRRRLRANPSECAVDVAPPVRVLPRRHDGQNTCCFTETCQSIRAKINLFFEKAKQHYRPRHPALATEGVSRSLRHVARDAMDAHLPQSGRRMRVRSSRVVLIPRRWNQANRDDLFAMGARKPGTPGRARSKP
jgi:hypothetical protein